MNKINLLIRLLVISISAGCNSDIVCSNRLNMLEHKCVYIAPLENQDPQVRKARHIENVSLAAKDIAGKSYFRLLKKIKAKQFGSAPARKQK